MHKQPISEQARLAMSLADCLGREGAINVCRANGWDGVLSFLLDETEVRQPPINGETSI